MGFPWASPEKAYKLIYYQIISEVKFVGWLTYIRTSENRKGIIDIDERLIALENQVRILENEIKQLKERD